MTRRGTTRADNKRRGLIRRDVKDRPLSARSLRRRNVVTRFNIQGARSYDEFRQSTHESIIELATHFNRQLEEIGLFIGADGRFNTIDHVGVEVRSGDDVLLITGTPGLENEAVVWDANGDAVSAGAGLPLDPQSHTISGGAITLDTHQGLGYLVTVDTEGGATTDDLETINGTLDGQLVVLQNVTSFRKVRLVETGNLRVSVFGSHTINNPQDKVTLIDDGSTLDAISVQAN